MNLRLFGDRAPFTELYRGIIDIDRAQRAAHAAYIGACSFTLLLVPAGLIGIHRHRVHAIPVERLAVARHLIVPDFGCAYTLNQVARMGRYPRRDHALADIAEIREAH